MLQSAEFGLRDLEYGEGCRADCLEAMRTDLHWQMIL